MKTYTAMIKAGVNGTTRTVRTQIRAHTSTDAKWLLQAIYGFHALASIPTEINETVSYEDVNAPKTPEQQRIENLKAMKKRADDALKSERDRQTKQRALRTLGTIGLP